MTAVPLKRRVLLVDDEPKIVDGLQRVLRPHRAVWEVATATSGAAALDAMEKGTFDVIVSDMRMPEMDGASLLTSVKARYPATMRIVLSGQTDAEAALRTVPVAHQFLSKPTDVSVLIQSLSRMAKTKDAISDVRVHAALGGLDTLPSVPMLCIKLAELMTRDDVSASAIAKLIETDPAIVMKLLQIVNSAFFGLRRRICSVIDAVAYLGVDLVRNLCVSLSIVNSMPVRAKLFDVDSFNGHAFAVATLARQIGGPGECGDTAFIAGMLHEIGKLAMGYTMPELYDEIALRAQQSGRSFEEEEEALGSCGHVKFGAYLLDLWGLPYPVVETIANLSRVLSSDSDELRSVDAVRIARWLIEGRAAAMGENAAERAYLARIGLLERLPALDAVASELAGTP